MIDVVRTDGIDNPPFSREELFLALRYGIRVPEAKLKILGVAAVKPRPVDSAHLLAKFRARAGSPEERLALASAYGLSYADLTNWVIRADLLRVEGMDAGAADVLAFAGVIGVHDLAIKREWRTELPKTVMLNRRVRAIQLEFQRNLERLQDSRRAAQLRERMAALDLRALVESATALAEKRPPEVVTATDVILVVKGAGSQDVDQTLDLFVNGFWPAVKFIEGYATITRRYDFDLPALSNPCAPAPKRAVTEIQAGEHRIWLVEPHWEAVLRPPKALRALILEWQMTTFTFGSHIREFVRVQSRRLHSRWPPQADTLASRRLRDFWVHYLSFALQYFFIFLFLGWVFRPGSRTTVFLLDRTIRDPARIVALAVLISMAAALPLALKTYRVMARRPLARLPVLPTTLLFVMIVAFLVNPLRYLLGLSLLALLQLAVLLARDAAWPCREKPDSDTDLSRFEIEVDERGEEYLVRRYMRREKVLLAPILYRYVLVLVAPIVLLVLTVARLLKWSIVLRFAGKVIENVLQNTLSGVLGDVVAYAMDPAQAHRVRSVIESDLRFFHRRRDVDHIHVFAHSQGTPITFETLFHHLPSTYRGKIGTYVTIGSVLSYYHQANPVLDPIHIQRFPVHAYPDFADGFRWYNFWNSFDPITEFSALDEYKLYDARQAEPVGDAGRSRFQPSRANPVNIKTRGTWLPWAGHTEYWSNLAEVQIPFAYRVLGDSDRDEWLPRPPRRRPANLSYFSYVGLLLIPVLAGTASLTLAAWRISYFLAQWLLSPAVIGYIEQRLPRYGFWEDVVGVIDALTEMSAIPDTISLLFLLLLLGVMSWLRLRVAQLSESAASLLKEEEGACRSIPDPLEGPELS